MCEGQTTMPVCQYLKTSNRQNDNSLKSALGGGTAFWTTELWSYAVVPLFYIVEFNQNH